MTSDILTDYLDAACEASRRGAAVLEDWRGRFQVKEKGRCDLVTDADLGSQKAIHSYLSERFPEHGFLGEESARFRSFAPRPVAASADLDRRSARRHNLNYAHDFPMYCVSTIGLWAGG